MGGGGIWMEAQLFPGESDPTFHGIVPCPSHRGLGSSPASSSPMPGRPRREDVACVLGGLSVPKGRFTYRQSSGGPKALLCFQGNRFLVPVSAESRIPEMTRAAERESTLRVSPAPSTGSPPAVDGAPSPGSRDHFRVSTRPFPLTYLTIPGSPDHIPGVHLGPAHPGSHITICGCPSGPSP